jgi:hypothetical protein
MMVEEVQVFCPAQDHCSTLLKIAKLKNTLYSNGLKSGVAIDQID